MLKIRILADDMVRERGLLAEHGLSFWIEKDGKTVLFDLGQSAVFSLNAKEMGITPEEADYIVISHGHYDHCGGLQYFKQSNKGRTTKVYIHPDAFLKKYDIPDKDKPFIDVGVPFEISAQDWMKDRVVYTRQPLMIDKGIMVSGEIPITNTFEDVPGDFHMERDGEIIKDRLLDEQMLLIEEGGEIAIFLGCSHPGVINCITYARELMPGKSIRLLAAGMHLEHVSPERLQMTIQSMKDFNIQKVIPLHCTGFKAMCEMKRVLGERCQIMYAGDTIKF